MLNFGRVIAKIDQNCFFIMVQTQLYTGKHVYSDSYDLAITNVFNKPELVFFNEKLIKEFMNKDFQLKLSKMNTGFDVIEFIGSKAIAFLPNNTWKHRRSLLTKVFNFDFIISQIPTMIHAANLNFQKCQIQYLATLPEKNQQHSVKLNLFKMMCKYTSFIVMAGFLGFDSMQQQLKGKTIQQQIQKLTYKSIQLSRDLLILMFGNKFLKLGLRKVDRQLIAFNEEINQILKAYIQEYRQKMSHKQSRRNTIIELILQDIEQSQGKGIAAGKESEITDDDLADQIKGFVIAGTETTANYLTMLILHIYENKQVYKRLKSQIDKYIKADQDITYENIKKITYLDFVMQESSRVFSVAEAGFQRILQEDSSICDIPLAKGTCLNIYLRPMLLNPKNFRDPFTFKPQRWEDPTQENKRLLQLTSYQFYGGPRGCIGKQLALTETKVGVIKFLMRYKSLVEPGINKRAFAFQLSAHLVDSEVVLERSQ